MKKKSLIYTKSGDEGKTSLIGGKRLSKSDIRIDAYGTIDELNAYLGLVYTKVENKGIKEVILAIQHNLFIIGSCLACEDIDNTKIKKIGVEQVTELEEIIDNWDNELPNLKGFIIPNGSELIAHVHIARCICRRAERIIVGLAENKTVDIHIIKYINRLSDLLFVMARKITFDLGLTEEYFQ